MTTQVPAQCFACTRLRPTEAPGGTATVSTCDAYPDGIPFSIAMGANHRTARGDERAGLTFEQGSTDEAARAFDAWRSVFGS